MADYYDPRKYPPGSAMTPSYPPGSSFTPNLPAAPPGGRPLVIDIIGGGSQAPVNNAPAPARMAAPAQPDWTGSVGRIAPAAPVYAPPATGLGGFQVRPGVRPTPGMVAPALQGMSSGTIPVPGGPVAPRQTSDIFSSFPTFTGPGVTAAARAGTSLANPPSAVTPALTPPTLTQSPYPLAPRPPIRPTQMTQGPAPAANPSALYQFSSGGPRTVGYAAGTPQAQQIQNTINSGTTLPPVGGGWITSSDGNAYAIRPPSAGERQQDLMQAGALQPAYAPRTLQGMTAALAIGQMQRLNEMRAKKMDLANKEADLKLKHLGIEQQNADTAKSRAEADNWRLTPIRTTDPTTGMPTGEVPVMFNTKTQEYRKLNLNPGPTFDEFRAAVANNPTFKGMSNDKLMDYWKATHGRNQ